MLNSFLYIKFRYICGIYFSLGFTYGTYVGPCRGGTGGTAQTISLNPGEFITRINGTLTADFVDTGILSSVRFHFCEKHSETYHKTLKVIL